MKNQFSSERVTAIAFIRSEFADIVATNRKDLEGRKSFVLHLLDALEYEGTGKERLAKAIELTKALPIETSFGMLSDFIPMHGYAEECGMLKESLQWQHFVKKPPANEVGDPAASPLVSDPRKTV